MGEGGGDQTGEQGVWVVGTRPELGVRLCADEEWMIDELDVLDQVVVRREPGESHPRILQVTPIPVIDLPAVAVPLVHQLLAVEGPYLGAFPQLGGVEPETHGPALVLHFLLTRHEVDHRIRRGRVELGAVGLVEPEDGAGELDHSALQTETQTQQRDLMLSCVSDRLDLALDTSVAESTGND